LWSCRNFIPKIAAVVSDVCQKNTDGDPDLKSEHKHQYQIQGQIAVTGILKFVVVFFTNKGTASV